MDQRLQQMREKQKKRRELLAKQLGVGSGDDLSKVLSSKQEQKSREARKRSSEPHKIEEEKNLKRPHRREKNDSHNAKKHDDKDTGMEVYKGSSTFLKGTQSLNPHNDYCQNYVDTGQRPQNYIRDVGLAERFGEYPKLKDLIRLKDDLIRSTNTPPMYLNCDLNTFDLKELGCKFDVILIEPPLEEYKKQAGIPLNGREATWNDVMSLEIEEVSAQRSFVFLWCGSSDGLDSGRLCLKKWGFRRCEDICWIKTNLKRKNPLSLDESLFVRTKEHCLMGIKGTVRRSTDGDFIHANVDIDLIIDDEMEPGSNEKPEEIFHIIEHFCLGRRRLHLFGRDTSRRPGWLTLGPQLTNSNFDKETFFNHFRISEDNLIGPVTGCTEEIERLRPKTPPPRDKKVERGGMKGRGSMISRRGEFNSASRIERTISGGNREPVISTKGFPVPFHDPRDRDCSFKNELRSQGYRNKDGKGGSREYEGSRNCEYSLR